MNGSPLSYPLNRGADVDAGGAADLQTDVMRFMAILSLCLVAIFALVQSLPAPTVPPPEPEPSAAKQTPVAPPPPPVVEPEPEPQVAELEVPVRHPLPPAPVYSNPQPTEALKNRVPLASNRVSVPTPAPAPAPKPATEPNEGFVLRFESDSVLLELAEKGTVALYAMSESQTHRLNLRAGTASFWPAATPRAFHQMHENTVPKAVQRALRQTSRDQTIVWGVTLPASLRDDVGRYVRDHRGGTLVIGGGAQLRLEP